MEDIWLLNCETNRERMVILTLKITKRKVRQVEQHPNQSEQSSLLDLPFISVEKKKEKYLLLRYNRSV